MKGCTMTKYSALAGCSQVGVVAGRHVAPARVDLGQAPSFWCGMRLLTGHHAACSHCTLHSTRTTRRSAKSTIGSGTPFTSGPTGVSLVGKRRRSAVSACLLPCRCTPSRAAPAAGRCHALSELIRPARLIALRASYRFPRCRSQASVTTQPGGAPWARARRSASATASARPAGSSSPTGSAPAEQVR